MSLAARRAEKDRASGVESAVGARPDDAPLATSLLPDHVEQWFAAASPPARGCWWWESAAWNELCREYGHDPLVQILVVIVGRLRLRENPGLIAGGLDAYDAAVRAQQWQYLAAPPCEVGRWLAARCWDPQRVQELIEVRMAPEQFYGAGGRPLLFGSADPRPLAECVMSGSVTPPTAKAYAEQVRR